MGCLPAERAAQRRAGYGSQPETSSCRKRARVADPKPSQPRGAGKAGLFGRFRCGARSQSQGSGGDSMEPSRAGAPGAQPGGAMGCPARAGQAMEGSRAPSRKRAHGASGCLPALAALGLSMPRAGERQHSPGGHSERRASAGAPIAQRRDGTAAKANAFTASCTGAGAEQEPNQARAGAGGRPSQGARAGRAVSVCVQEEWVVHEHRGDGKGWRTLDAGASRGPAVTPGALDLDPSMDDGGLDALLAAGGPAREGGSGLGSGQGASGAAASSGPTLGASDQAASASGDSRAALEAALARGNCRRGVAGPGGDAGPSRERTLREVLRCSASEGRSDVSAAGLGLGVSSDAAPSIQETGVLPGVAGAQAEVPNPGLPLTGLSDSRAEADTGSDGLGLSFGSAGVASMGLGAPSGSSAGAGAPSETSLERALRLGPGRTAGLAAPGGQGLRGSPASGELERALGLAESPALDTLDGTLGAALAPHTYPRCSGLTRSAQGGSALGAPDSLGLGFDSDIGPGLEPDAPASRGRTPARLGLRRTPVRAGGRRGLTGSPLQLGDDVLLPPVGGRSVLASHCAVRASPSGADALGLPPTGLRSSGNRRRLRRAFYEGADIVAEADPDPDPDPDPGHEAGGGGLDEGICPGASPEGSPASAEGRSRARPSSQRAGRSGEPRASPDSSPAPKRRRRSARAAKRRPSSDGLHGRFNQVAGDFGDGAGPAPSAAERRQGRRGAQRGEACEGSAKSRRDLSTSPDRAQRPAARRGARRRRHASAEPEAGDEQGPAAGVSPGQSGGAGGTQGHRETPGRAGARNGCAAEAHDGGDDAGGGFASLRHVSLFEREARRAVGRVAAAGAGRRAGQWLSGTAAAAQRCCPPSVHAVTNLLPVLCRWLGLDQWNSLCRNPLHSPDMMLPLRSALQRPFAAPRPRQRSARRTPQPPPARAPAAGAPLASGAAGTGQSPAAGAPGDNPVPHDGASARASVSPAGNGRAGEPAARASVQAAAPRGAPARLKGRPGERPRNLRRGAPVGRSPSAKAVQRAPAGGAGGNLTPKAVGLFQQFMFAARG